MPDLRRLLLERFPVFRELPAPRLERLLAEAQLLKAPAGSVLFDATQPCRGFPLVLEGAVRVPAMPPPTAREAELEQLKRSLEKLETDRKKVEDRIKDLEGTPPH